ncbi:MAG: glycosyltransferase family 4 protein [Chloroflexi bacterium]|nr:glycosyltransferase family 4 protein [Chloroflexota bacterium]
MVQPRKTRVCYFLHSGSVGGATLSLLYLLQQMDRERYEPVVVFLHDTPMRQQFQELGVQTLVPQGMTYFSHTTGESLGLRNPRGWSQVVSFIPSVWKSYRLVQGLRPDVVHANSSTLSPQVIGAKLAGAKVVWHIREHVLDGFLGLRKGFLQWVARRYADALITIMEGAGERLGTPDKATLVYNFVDFAFFDRRLRDEALAQGSPRPRSVVMLGGVDRIKGTLELAQACQLVQGNLGEVRFIVAGYGGEGAPKGRLNPRRWLSMSLGSGRYVEQVLKLCKPHDHSGLELVGVVKDVPRLLAQSDLLVFPSTEPHFARPVIEAGAMALPVVASDIPGPQELVVHGKTGLLVPPGNPRALADAIIALLSDDDKARSMGEAGYQQAQRLFNARINAQATFAIYERVLRGEPVAPPDHHDQEKANPPSPRGAAIHPLWASAFLVWMAALVGIYVWNILHVGGRWDRVQDLVGRLFG